jgi:hypothetical protein
VHVTAKEELREAIDELSEELAAAWLEKVQNEDPRSGVRYGAIDRLPPEERAGALRAFFEAWRDKDAYLSDEQWEEFTRDFDAQRPHRPLFG